MPGMNTSTQKTALVTGGAGGLGSALVQQLVAQGWKVWIADYSEAALAQWQDQAQVQVVQLDVTQRDSVDAAVATVRRSSPELHAIVNFAGVMQVGSLIEMPERVIQRMMDVNVMGTVRVNQAFFPLLKRDADRRSNGRIVNISSETGWQTTAPFAGPYSMSKHAIESYSHALRRELQMVDIPVVVVQPGPFKTEMTGSILQTFTQAAQESQVFRPFLEKVGSIAATAGDKAHPPRLLADIIVRALTAPRPKTHYSVKPDLGRVIISYLPTRLVDWILYRVCLPKQK